MFQRASNVSDYAETKEAKISKTSRIRRITIGVSGLPHVGE